MASIENTEPRLINGPPIPGHAPPQWLPGKNRLDVKYWNVAQLHNTVKRWLALGWLRVDLDEDIEDPATPPTDAELADYTKSELAGALKDPSVPPQWHPALEAEIEKRAAAAREAVKKRLPPVVPPTSGKGRKSLSGLRVDEALPLIAAEGDVDTLEAWDEADKRKSVGDAIDARLAELALDDGVD